VTAPVTAGGTLGVVYAGTWLNDWTPAVRGSISGPVHAGGDIYSLNVSGDIRGVVKAGGTIGVLPDMGEGYPYTIPPWGGYFPDPGTCFSEGVRVGGELAGPLGALQSITHVRAGAAVSGSIWAGGNISTVDATRITAPISAGGWIGRVSASVSSGWGAPGPDLPHSVMRDMVWGGDAPTPPALGQGGDVTGDVTAGEYIGRVTAYGEITGNVSAGSGVYNVWALGDIFGNVAAG